ncbi:MAG TPA: carboxypeptidase-like regulatory domain-containing protein, partial [Gemmatimonadales bacterium]
MSRPAALMIALIVGLALRSGSLAAQAPAAVSGRVYDAATGSPVAEAELALGELRAVSGDDGRFRFGSVAPGTWSLAVRRLGYHPWRAPVHVSPGL